MSEAKWVREELKLMGCRSKREMQNSEVGVLDLPGFIIGCLLNFQLASTKFHACPLFITPLNFGKSWGLRRPLTSHQTASVSLRSCSAAASLSLSHSPEKNGIIPTLQNQGVDKNEFIDPSELQLSCYSSSEADQGAAIVESSSGVDASSGSDWPQNDSNRCGKRGIRLLGKRGQEKGGLSVLERASFGAASGALAGPFTYACLHPLDTVKTKLQTRGAMDLYSGPVDVILKVLKTEGIVGFYKGISAVLVGSAIYFGTCELGKSVLAKIPAIPAIAIPPVAGAMGNIASSLILVPKELITQRMQAGAAGRSWEILMQTVKADGVKGLYVGYSAALLRDLPASVISYSSFEYLKLAWLKRSKIASLDPWQSVISGALAGAIAAALTTPVDVVKTRLMTQTKGLPIGSHFTTTRPSAFSYKGFFSTLERIWLEEGWSGVTSGMGPRLLHSVCLSAIGFFAFEMAKNYFVIQNLSSRRKK